MPYKEGQTVKRSLPSAKDTREWYKMSQSEWKKKSDGIKMNYRLALYEMEYEGRKSGKKDNNENDILTRLYNWFEW